MNIFSVFTEIQKNMIQIEKNMIQCIENTERMTKIAKEMNEKITAIYNPKKYMAKKLLVMKYKEKVMMGIVFEKE